LSGFLVLALLTVPTLSHADDSHDLLHAYSMTTGVFYEGGTTDYSAYRNRYGVIPSGMGFRYFERNGIISGTVAALFMAVAGAVAASGPKSVRTWEDANYRYTETTYYSAAEQAAIRERSARTSGELMGSKTQSFDLQLYSRNVGGNTTGWKATMMLGSLLEAEDYRLDLGMYFGRTTSAVVHEGKHLLTGSSSVGVPIRFSWAVPLTLLFAEFDWNWNGHGDPKPDVVQGTTLAHDSRNMPWRVGASASIFHRLYLEAAVTTPRLTSKQFGYSTSVGARF
jgi:hypothetical protein